MSLEQAAKAPQTEPTSCPVCGAPLYFSTSTVYRFECGSSDIIRNGMHWPQEAKDAAPPCLYIKGLRERLADILSATEATA